MLFTRGLGWGDVGYFIMWGGVKVVGVDFGVVWVGGREVLEEEVRRIDFIWLVFRVDFLEEEGMVVLVFLIFFFIF